MGFVVILSNWYQMCLNLIYCYSFTMYGTCLDNKCYNYISYVFLLYLLQSLYLWEFIVVYTFIAVECIYSICISTIFIGNVFIAVYIYLFILIGLDLIFFYSIHVL